MRQSFQFNVTLDKSYNQQAEPGSSQTLVLTGTPGTQVGILGVDQAVYLLRRKDLLTREKVMYRSRDIRPRDLNANSIFPNDVKHYSELNLNVSVVTITRLRRTERRISTDLLSVSCTQLFQQLDAKDLGCGAGGGTDSVQALYDAGVLLLANTDDARPKRNGTGQLSGVQ
ncbi:unnamed protein product [Ixodes persulcatus]